jgi:hypothetical protein
MFATHKEGCRSLYSTPVGQDTAPQSLPTPEPARILRQRSVPSMAHVFGPP